MKSANMRSDHKQLFGKITLETRPIGKSHIKQMKKFNLG